MTRKVDFPTSARDIQFTLAGDDAWSGSTPENSVSSPSQAITRTVALDPVPSDFFPASINASETGVYTDRLVMPNNVSSNCRFAALVTSGGVALEAGDSQALEWGAVVTTGDNDINFLVDGKRRVTSVVNTMIVGFDGATARVFPNPSIVFTTGNIGIKVTGACDEVFATRRNVTLLGGGAIGVEHTATSPSPVLYVLERSVFMNEDQTLIKMDTVAAEQIEVTLTSVRAPTGVSTTGSTVFDCGVGIVSSTAQSLEADFIAKVRDGGRLGLDSNVCFGDTKVFDGGIAIFKSIGLYVGDIEVDAGGILEVIINRFVGTVTNNGEINGIINGVRYGNWLQPYGGMFQRDNAIDTTINTVDVWEDVVNFSTGELEQTSFAASVLTTGDIATTYKIDYSLCIDNGTNRIYETAIEIDGVIQDESISCTTIPTGGRPDNLGGTFIKTVAAGKDIKLVIRNLSDTTDVLVVHASVSIVGIR